MPTERHKIVYLSFISTDLPIWNIIEAKASLYQKSKDQFHLLLTQENLPDSLDNKNNQATSEESSVLPLKKPYELEDISYEESLLKNTGFADQTISSLENKKNLLWLEISPYKVMLRMQNNNRFSYHHFLERGVYGISRYSLNSNDSEPNNSFRLRNYTRHLQLDYNPMPTSLQVQYELWSANLKLGTYLLHLDIDNL
ncbi:MAG: hypothetical protein QNJ18_23730 [Xenococcaceae cyanobacterium MO_167.B52]|nr:hypothetical protein [Xenococcaceae cyanobacterium MO_167.B52]